MNALDTLHDSLVELKITSDKKLGANLEDYPIGSFAKFRKLKSIDVEAMVMLGTKFKGREDYAHKQSLEDSVPPNLESLTLRNCGHWKTNHVSIEIRNS